jgi:hypothetical protein
MEKKRYLTDLNTRQNYGLNHELWCIADALMLGESVGRNIMVRGFYPDYNSKFKIDLSHVINLDATNKALKDSGFSVQLEPFDGSLTWQKTKYQNPVFGHFDHVKGKARYEHIIAALKPETHDNIDLFTSFVWPLSWPFGDDKELMKKATCMFLCMKPSDFMLSLVKERRELLGIGKGDGPNNENDFLAIHVRLEDDWVTHLTSVYRHTPHFGKTEELFSRQIKDVIKSMILKTQCSSATGDDTTKRKIFLATGLGKSKHKNNDFLDELVEAFGKDATLMCKQNACDWKSKFPGIGEARELEGYIDFLICLEAKSAILASHSSFSVSLKYCRDFLNLESQQYPG